MTEWKRYKNGHGYCAKRLADGWLLPWTFRSQRKDVAEALREWMGDATRLDDFKVVRVICEAPDA